jgi:hypothetical protein
VVREQVDLDTLTAELLAVVHQTVQSTSVSLRLRPSSSASQDRSSTGASPFALAADTSFPDRSCRFVKQSLMALPGRPERMKIGGRPATSVSLGAGEPVKQSDAGASGTPNCCHEHATQTP